MRLTRVSITNYKSIDDSQPVDIDPGVTVLVGKNESGKTAFLEAIYKANAARGSTDYDPIHDYPRRRLTGYLKVHATQPAQVARLTYQLDDADAKAVNSAVGVDLVARSEFTITVRYDGSRTISLSIDEGPYIRAEIAALGLGGEVAKAAKACKSVEELVAVLKEHNVLEDGAGRLAALQRMIDKRPDDWDWALRYHVWSLISSRIPKFLYFDDYDLLPGKVNLQALSARANNGTSTREDETVLALFRMAEIDLPDVLDSGGYEEGKAKLEAISNTITDQIFQYWKQNQDLDVEFDIKADPSDQAPFNSGPNLYVRIRNRRHRVTVPFSQRSKGFVWFFSFLVWFDSVRESLDHEDELILLLDEPGLSLHALAQADLLVYVDELAQEHQVIYSTHSPFMVRSERLHQVRAVQDTVEAGTRISSDVSSSDPSTIFPLQAALGYTIAQNLFIPDPATSVGGAAR